LSVVICGVSLGTSAFLFYTLRVTDATFLFDFAVVFEICKELRPGVALCGDISPLMYEKWFSMVLKSGIRKQRGEEREIASV
jgi:hypothetical protein